MSMENNKENEVCENCGHPKSYHIIDKNWCQGDEDNCRCKKFRPKKTAGDEGK